MTNLWKRSISMFLALIMVIGMVPTSAFATETEPAETTSVTEPTVPVTEAPEVETTEAPTEPEPVAEETTVPVETEEEPVEPSEETVPAAIKDTAVATAPLASAEETISAETIPEETVPEETEAVATMTRCTAVPAVELPDDTELLAGYLDQQFFGTDISFLGTAAGERLSGDTKLAYDALVDVTGEIAGGNRASTIVSLGYDLGTVSFDDGTSGEYYADIDVAFTGTTFEDSELDALLNALLADLPYELYWFDKVTGLGLSMVVSNGQMWLEFYFEVADNYQGTEQYSVDTDKTGAPKIAAANAKAVVDDIATDVAAMTNVDADYETLLAYKDWICAEVSYNSAAAEAENFTTESDPWQLIYVFDGDDTTDVVCEGYSKAFQYLCDLTDFTTDTNGDENVTCYSVSGQLVDVGAHMWNIVDIAGSHYLADITNSDTGTVGEDGSLFLVGGTPGSDGSYTFTTQGTTTGYAYNEKTEALWGDNGILVLATANYEPVVEEDTESSDEMTQAEFEAAVADSATKGAVYYLTGQVTLTSDMTIPSGAQVYIQEGGMLLVSSGVELTNQGHIQLEGGKCIIEGGITSTGSIQINSGIMYFGDAATWNISNMNGPIIRAKYGDTASKMVITNTTNLGSGVVAYWNNLFESRSVVPGLTLEGVFAIREWDNANYEWKMHAIKPADLTAGDYLSVTALADNPDAALDFNDEYAYYLAQIYAEEGTWDVDSSISYNYNGTTYSFPIRLERPQMHGFYTEPTASNETYLGYSFQFDHQKEENAFYYIFTDQTGKSIVDGSFTTYYTPYDFNEVAEVTWEKISDTVYKIIIKPEVVQELSATGNGFPLHVKVTTVDAQGYKSTTGIGQVWCSPTIPSVDGLHGFYSEPAASDEANLNFEYFIDSGKSENAFYYVYTGPEGWDIVDGSFTIMDNPFDENPVDEVTWEQVSDTVYKITVKPDVVEELCANGGSFPVHVQVTVQNTLGAKYNYGIGQLWCKAEQQGLYYDFHCFYSTDTASDETRLYDVFLMDPDAEENAFYYIFTDTTGFSIVDGSFTIMDNPDDRNAVEGVSYEKISDTVYKIIIAPEKVADIAENGGYIPVFVEVTATNEADGYTNTYGWGQIQCMVVETMTQADFAAAVAEAAAAGEVYYLNANVTLTEDMAITTEVRVDPNATLTVDGCKLTVGAEAGFSQLISNGGTVHILSNAALAILDTGLMQIWNGGTLTIEEGADITGVNADQVWINLTEAGVNTVNGLEAAMLGAIYNPSDAAGLEAAYALTDTYAHIGVYPNASFTLDRSITIPEGDDLNLMNQVTLTVPAGFTLTNNGMININAANRLEVLEGGALVNNGTITVNQYGQLYYYEGTLTDNGTIEGDGDIVTNVMSHQELMNSLVEGSSWVHESETTLETTVNEGVLKISMGSGDPAPEFYLVEGGILRVPSGTRLEVYNPLIVSEGGKVIVEEGGTLYVNGTLSVEGGTVYIAEGGTLDDSGENCDISGKITREGETDPYLSETWLNNDGDGWYWPEGNELYRGGGLDTMDCHWRVYFLNEWDAANLVWNRTPVIPTEDSAYMTITLISDMEETSIRDGEEYADYYVCVDITGTLDHQNVNLYANGYTIPYEIFERSLGFYSAQEAILENYITDHNFMLNTSDGAENAIYLIQRDERTLSNVTWTVNSWGEDYNALVSDGEFLTYEEITAGKVWKVTVDPEFVDYIQYDYKNFELRYTATVTDSEGNEETRSDGVWINPPELLNPVANLHIDYNNYLIYETGAVFKDYFTGEYDENGNEIWERERTTLPNGVSYVVDENKIILDNASLSHLDLIHYESGYDDEGNFWEHRHLPSENLTITLVGDSTISNPSDMAMMLRNGVNVTFTGNGSLHLLATNSPENVNDEGNCYAYPTVAMEGGANMTVADNATVTAEVAGSGFHGDYPAQMEAINASGTGTLTLSGSATLNIVTPAGTRTLDESQENYGGARGIVETNIVVSDNATLNTGSIYLWNGVDFTMNGGTVNLDPIGEVFYNNYWQGYMLSNLGIYLEHEDSVFTMNDGTINMDLSPNGDNDSGYVYYMFQGINAALGDVCINGGVININSETVNISDETTTAAYGGNGIAIQCGWNETGPDASLPASSLTITGGTVNIYPVGQEEYEGIYVAPLATAELTGGSVYADNGAHYLEGDIAWNGDVQLTGDVHIFDGSQITVADGGSMTITHETNVYEGGKIVVENGGSLQVSGHLNVEGIVYIRSGGSFETVDSGYVTGEITYEGETAPYLTSTWLDNSGEGWYMNEEFHRTDGLMSMEEHWRIFFLHTWDETNLVWNSEPVVPTVSSQYMTITPVADTDNPTIREDQSSAYSDFFVCVNVFGTLDKQDVTLWANGYEIPFEIHERHTGFFWTTDFSLDSIIEGHDITLDTTADENVIYWLVKDPVNYDVVSMDVSYNTWNEDYTEYTGGDDLVVITDEGGGVYKFTVDPDYVDYIQYDWKNFEIQVAMTLDHNGDEEIYEEPNNGGLWVHAPELKKPVAAMGIDNDNYLIFDTGAIFRDVLAGYDEYGYEIWDREKVTGLPGGVSYVLEKNQLILDGANLINLDLAPYGSGENEDGSTWEVFGLPNENLTITLYGENTIINNANAAVVFNHGLNVTINGTGTLYAKTTNYTDVGNAFSTINVWEGSTLTIGGNANVTAALSGHGYWEDGNAATCHAISGGYSGETLEITESATLTTVLPNGVRRYDGTGTLSQVGGYVGIQNFNSITVSGGTLNTDHLNFYNGGDFNLESGVVNLRDIGGMNYMDENGAIEYHYEGIRMCKGNINISGGELNIDVTPLGLSGETDSTNRVGFYGINGIYSTINISDGTVNITGSSDGWAILADSEWNESGYVEGTGSSINVTGGTINVDVADKTYHGGILVSEICEGYFGGGEINDDYGIHRFYGNTVWGEETNGGGTVLNGAAAGVYTHGPGEFTMYDGQINLTGDVNEETGEQNRGHIMINGGTVIYGGQINLTNGTLINNMNVGIEGGEITVVNDWADVPGIENELYLPVVGGTIDITTNGTAIVNHGTLHQMGGQITAVNTETAEHPVIHSTGSVLLNDGTMDLTGGYYGIVQNYDFEAAAEDNESMLFAGAMEEGQTPTLNISGTKMGIYASAPVVFPWNANINIDVEGTPTDEGRDWPIAILIDALTAEGSTENVSYLSIGGSVLNLTSRDTAGVDLTSKGIVAWYSPVYIEAYVDETTGTSIEPSVTIDAEVAIYSMSNSAEESNLTIDEEIRSLSTGDLLELSYIANEDGTYLHTLQESDGSYAGNVKIAPVSSVSSLEELKALMTYNETTGRWSLTQTVEITGSFTLTDIIVDVINGGELIVPDGMTLTVSEGSHLIAQQNGKILVEAGGQIINNGIMAADNGGSIRISGTDGYVHGSGATLNVHYRNGVMSSVTGVSYENLQLMASCTTEDQINYILGLEDLADYSAVEIMAENSITLNTMTIPEKVTLNTAIGVTVTVADGAFLTVNGSLGVRNGALVVNGKIINNSGMTFNIAEVTVNGTFENNGPTFINDGSVMTVNGTLDSKHALHVGFWRDAETASPAGTLNIAEGGVLNNYDYLLISPDTYVAEEDRYSGGIVNVSGTLNNLYIETDDGVQSAFVEQHGDLTIDGTMYNEGILGVNGTTVVGGTLKNQNTIDVYGTLDIYGSVENNGSIRLLAEAAKLTTYKGASLVNNMSISNRTQGAVVTLAEGTYTHGSYEYNGTVEPAELTVMYFDGTVTKINGAENSQLSLMYEGSDEATLLAAAQYTRDNGYYNCFLRVVGPMTISEGNLLTIDPNCYLVVMDNNSNYQGSLTVNGDIVNQGGIRLFAADMTINQGGSVYNANELTAYGTAYGAASPAAITVNGILENEYTGTMDLSTANYTMGETGKIQNNLVNGTLGTISGVEIADQTLWTNITDTASATGQEQLVAAIGKVQDEGYRHGIVWILTDTNIASDMVIPANVTVMVKLGATLTVDSGVILQTDGYVTIAEDGKLDIYGTLGAGGMVNVSGSMYVETSGNVGLGNDAEVNILEGGTLTIDGYFGVDGGTLNVLGTYNNSGTISVTWTEEGFGEANGVDLSQVTLWMPINATFPGHDETDIAAMLSYAQEKGFGFTQVLVVNDLTFAENFTVPTNMTFSIGTYRDESTYSATVVTIPAGKTLTVNGNVQIANGSKLVIEEGASLDKADGNLEIYGELTGTCGSSAVWTLSNNTLTISGSGDMFDYTEGAAPWAAYGDQISSVKIGSGITGIGAYAFRDVAAASILVPRTVTAIGENAFAENVTLKVYHDSAAETYATSNDYTSTYIHEIDLGSGDCVVDGCDYSLNSAVESATTTEEKVEAVKNADTETLKEKIETEMESSDTGASDTMDLIQELEEEVKTESDIAVSAEVEATDTVVQKTFANVSQDAIVGAALNADDGVSEVKLVISDAETTTTADLGEAYNAETAVLFSMTLEGVADTENLDVPVKITLPVPEGITDTSKMKVLHYHNGTTEEVAYTLSTDEEGKQYVSFVLSSFSDFAFVEEASVEEEYIQTSYKNGWQTQIGLIEPWFLRLNVTIADANFVQVDYSNFTDYGYYFVRASDLNTEGTPTIEQIVTNENAVHYEKDAIKTQTAGSYTYFYVDYDKGLYTYEMSDSLYAVFYFVEGDGSRQYTVVRESNLKQLLDARKDDESFNELERAVYHKMSDLETDITAYREGKSDSATTMGQLLAAGKLGTPSTDVTYKFGVSTQIVLIEPWGIQVNAAIVPPTGSTIGDHIDYAEAEDYGVVMYYDVEKQITDATQLDTAEEMLALTNRAYVFSKTDGSAFVSSGNSNYITARYNKDIFTYQLDTDVYAMYYVKIGGNYYYSTVRTYNVYDLANERGNDESFGDELERTVYCDMVDLYATVTAYRDDYFSNNP